jgi:hypothetical protein
MTWWEENWYSPSKHTILDLGPCSEHETVERAVRIGKYLGDRKRVQFMEVNNLIVRVPPDRVQDLLAHFPQLVAGGPMMMGCTHKWQEGPAVFVVTPTVRSTAELTALEGRMATAD